MKLEDAVKSIKGLDEEAMRKAKQNWNNICKPIGSLGRLEDMVIRLCGITGTDRPELRLRAVVIMCADNGVVDEGVTQCGNEVTAAVAKNITKGTSSINILSEMANAQVFPVDIGMAQDINAKGLINRKVRNSTYDIAKSPAMTRSEAIKAIETGIDIMFSLKNQGYSIFVTGEMGIGNTTTSSAVAAVLLGEKAEKMTGRGAGLTTEAYKKKIEVIKKAIKINHPKRDDPIDVLSNLGGFDIAGMCGLFIGAAAAGVPIIIDGFISSVAALTAVRIAPACADYIFPSHCSAEPGGEAVLDAIGMKPYLDCGMSLGEGTGGVMALTLFDYALLAYNKIPSFGEAKIKAYVPLK